MAGRPKHPGPAYVRQYYANRTAKVSFVGHLFDDTQEADGGTGLLIGDTLVLTANHLIGRLDDYESTKITITLPNQPSAFTARLVHRDPDHDLALLRLDQAPANLRPLCPLEAVTAIKDVPQGLELAILSYPLGYDLGPSPAWLNPEDKPTGRWRAAGAIDPGASGAPVILTQDGTLLGVAVGAVRWQERGGRMTPVTQVSWFYPYSAMAGTPLQTLIEQDSNCWKVAAPPVLESDEDDDGLANLPINAKPTLNPLVSTSKTEMPLLAKVAIFASELFGTTPAKAATLPTPGPDDLPPLDLTTYFAVQTEPTTTPPTDQRVFDIELKAEREYSILRCSPRARAEASATNVSCTLTDEGRKATFHYELSPMAGGSGYWDGVIVLQQRRGKISSPQKH